MKQLSPKHRPKILKDRFHRGKCGFNTDNGNVAFDTPKEKREKERN